MQQPTKPSITWPSQPPCCRRSEGQPYAGQRILRVGNRVRQACASQRRMDFAGWESRLSSMYLPEENGFCGLGIASVKHVPSDLGDPGGSAPPHCLAGGAIWVIRAGLPLAERSGRDSAPESTFEHAFERPRSNPGDTGGCAPLATAYLPAGSDPGDTVRCGPTAGRGPRAGEIAKNDGKQP